MDDIRESRIDDEDNEREEERQFESAQRDEVPFDIPRD